MGDVEEGKKRDTNTHLVNAAHDGPHRRISRPVHGLSVVCRSPWGAINVYEVRFVSHAVSFDQVGHIRLIQHSDPGDFRVVSYAHTAHAVVPGCCHLAGASGSVAFKKNNTLIRSTVSAWQGKCFYYRFSALGIWVSIIGWLTAIRACKSNWRDSISSWIWIIKVRRNVRARNFTEGKTNYRFPPSNRLRGSPPSVIRCLCNAEGNKLLKKQGWWNENKRCTIFEKFFPRSFVAIMNNVSPWNGYNPLKWEFMSDRVTSVLASRTQKESKERHSRYQKERLMKILLRQICRWKITKNVYRLISCLYCSVRQVETAANWTSASGARGTANGPRQIRFYYTIRSQDNLQLPVITCHCRLQPLHFLIKTKLNEYSLFHGIPSIRAIERYSFELN